MESLYLIMAITDRHKSERVIGHFKENNVFTTDVVLGTGTAAQNKTEYFYLNSAEKAVIIGIITEAGLNPLMKGFSRKLYFDLPQKGIAVAIPMNSIGGKRSLEYMLDGQSVNLLEKRKNTERGSRMSVNANYELIMVIANEGYSDLIMDAARAGGASGGTVIKAKGTSAEYSEKFFGFSIASEKEIHMIVTPAQGRNSIMKSIMERAGLDSKAQSIVFSLPVSHAVGLWMPD